MTMNTIQEFEAAAANATQASSQAKAWAIGPINSGIMTDSGLVPTIAEFIRVNQERADAAINAIGWVFAGDFTAGCTVTKRNQYVLVVGGERYRWDGVLPKVVASGSAPTPIATGAWVLVGDATLRGDLANSDGSELVGFQQSGTGAVVRTAESKLREIVSVKDFGAKGDGVTDDTAAIQAALNAGVIAYIPSNREFVTTSKLIAVSGAGLIGDGEGSRIRLAGITTDSVIEGNGVTGFYIDGVVLDGDNSVKVSGSHGVKATNCHNWSIGWLKVVRAQNWGVAFYGGSTGNTIGTLVVEDAKTSSALMFSGSSGNKVGKLIAKRCGGFGAQIFDGSHENQIDVIEAEDGGLEALGINSSSHRNRVGSTFALRAGDNGVSISGDNNVVTSVVADGVRFHGVCFYGSYNKVGNVFARNVGQHSAVPYAGVTFTPAFGGRASGNIVDSVIAIDDQTTPTMDYAVWATNNTDVAWTSGKTVGASSWRKYNNRVYKSVLGGVTGSTPPTHSSGTVSDGGVAWKYMLDAAPATHNKVGPTTARGFSNLKFAGTHLGNYFGDKSDLYCDLTFAATFGIRREATAWASSQNIGYAAWRTNAGNLYVCSNVGGTSSIEPTHTVGTVTGTDGIAWRFVEGATAIPEITATTGGVQVNGKLQLISVTSGTNTASIMTGAGTPEAMVAETLGSIFVRHDARIGNEVYIHTDAAGSANWQTVLLRRRGPTSIRPTVPSGGAYAGVTYFDTTLGKPLWSNSTGGWVDATGATV